MLERYVGDPNVDMLPEIFLDGESEDDAIVYSGLTEVHSAQLFDDPDLVQAEFDRLTEEELGERTKQEKSKANIERILALDGEERSHEGRRDAYRDFHTSYFAYNRESVRLREELTHQSGSENRQALSRNDMVVMNLGLAASVARRWWSKQHLKQSDLLQLGTFGLMRAAETYDPLKGAFSTYARLWISSKIAKGVKDTERTIRYPLGVEDFIIPVARIVDSMERGSHQMPVQPTELWAACKKRHDIRTEQVKEYIELPVANVGLDEIDEPSFHETGYEEVESQVFAGQVATLAKFELSSFEFSRSNAVIFLMHSLGNVSFAKIGKRFGVTAGSVYQRYERQRQKFEDIIIEQAMGGDSTDFSV